MRQTIKVPGATLAVSGTGATYRVPAPTNGVRVTGLVTMTAVTTTDGTGAGLLFLSHKDRSGNSLAIFPGVVQTINTAQRTTFAPGASNASVGTIAVGGGPCRWPLEDGDLVELGMVLTAGNCTVSEVVLTLQVEPE